LALGPFQDHRDGEVLRVQRVLGVERLVTGVGDPPPLVEALRVGQTIRCRTDMPFAKACVAIAPVAEQLGQGGFPWGKAIFATLAGCWHPTSARTYGHPSGQDR